MKRAGVFYVDDEMIATDPERVRAIMGWVIVLEAEHQPQYQRYRYVALSEGFEEIEDDAAPPSYHVNFYEGGQIQFYPDVLPRP